LKKLYVGGRLISVTGSGYEPRGEFYLHEKVLDHDNDVDLQKMLKAANLCSDTRLVNVEGQWKIKGDPTEGAFVVAAVKAGINIDHICKLYPRVGEIPFSSETKRMTALYKEPDGVVAYSNGAAEVILHSCEYVWVAGREMRLDEGERKKLHNTIHGMAGDALRVLATAYKRLPDEFTLDETVNTGMVLLGLGGMIDPPAGGRESLKPA
jgi:Ca2+-transporting ATPase